MPFITSISITPLSSNGVDYNGSAAAARKKALRIDVYFGASKLILGKVVKQTFGE